MPKLYKSQGSLQNSFIADRIEVSFRDEDMAIFRIYCFRHLNWGPCLVLPV